MSKMLYNDKPEIGSAELSHIYLALLTSADSIVLNRNISPAKGLGKKEYATIEERLGYLEDNGLIAKWTYPFEIPSQSDPKLIIFPEKDYSLWEQIINETFLSKKNLLSLFKALDDPRHLKAGLVEERTSKIVAIRREYWSFATCSALKIDQILNSYGSFQPDPVKSASYDFSRIKEPIIRKLFARFGIPDLAVLKAEDICRLHKKNKPFRDIIDLKVKEHAGTSDTEIVDSVLEDITQEVFGLCNSYVSSMGVGTFVTNLLMAVASIHYAIYSFLPIGNDVINELSKRQKYGFVYFMSKVKARSEKALADESGKNEYTIY